MENKYKITTMGIFAHANAGKTTLTEWFLQKTHVINEVGRVDKGNTITDSLDVEKKRGITIKSSYVTFNLNDIKIQLIDTPGHIDFSAEVVRAMNVLDAAVLIVSGVEHVETQTIFIWEILQKLRIPTFIYVNKLDRIGADFSETLQSIKSSLSVRAIPFIGIDSTLNITDLSPAHITEKCADYDDSILDYYLNNSECINNDWYDTSITSMINDCELFPVFGGSALKNIGLDNLLTCLEKFIPYNQHHSIHNPEEFSGYVYMTRIVGEHKETYIKLLSGCIYNRMRIKTSETTHKITSLHRIEGNDIVHSQAAYVGEIAIVTGVDFTIGSIVGKSDVHSKPLIKLNPPYRVTLSPDIVSGYERFQKAIKLMNDEDPALNLKYNANRKKYQIDLMGELHGESIIALLKEKFNVAASLSEQIIIYKETPLNMGSGSANYTGCSGIDLSVRPLPRGSGIQITSLITADDLFPKYQKQAIRLIGYYIQHSLYGWALTDTAVEITGARWDMLGSSPFHFNIAVPIAFARAINNCGTKLLEPVMSYTLTLNKEFYTQIMSVVMNFRKIYSNIRNLGDTRIQITGESYISEVDSILKNLKRITSGAATMDYYAKGFDDTKNNNIVQNEFIGQYNPFKLHDFMEKLGASRINLDRGL